MGDKAIMIDPLLVENLRGLNVTEDVEAGELIVVMAGRSVGKSMLATTADEELIEPHILYQKMPDLDIKEFVAPVERQFSRNPFHESGKRKRGKARRKWR